jgi:hypothetical protein
MPNLNEIGPVVWISIADTHGTHIDFFYILDYSLLGRFVSYEDNVVLRIRSRFLSFVYFFGRVVCQFYLLAPR